MLSSLFNLLLALRADAWVGTLTSNWCRLIDELRSTVAAKAAGPYVNVGPSLSHATVEGLGTSGRSASWDYLEW
jgi:hypothetical protein